MTDNPSDLGNYVTADTQFDQWRSWSAVSASAPVGVDVERINCTSRTGFAASTLFSTASCSARRSRYSRATLPWCALRSGGWSANSQRQ